LQQFNQSIRNLEATIVANLQVLAAERNADFVSRLLRNRLFLLVHEATLLAGRGQGQGKGEEKV